MYMYMYTVYIYHKINVHVHVHVYIYIHVTTYRRIEAALSSKSSHTSSSSLPATDQPAAGEDGDGFRWNTTGDHASTGSSSKAGHIYLGEIYMYMLVERSVSLSRV